MPSTHIRNKYTIRTINCNIVCVIDAKPGWSLQMMFQNTNSSFENTNSSFQNSGGHFAKYWEGAKFSTCMPSVHVRLRYANLSNIMLGISNSLFDILL